MNRQILAENFEQSMFAFGEVIWQKKSGARIVLAKKGDSLHIPLIKKLIAAGEEVEISIGLEAAWVTDFISLFAEYKNEQLMKNKISIRKKILSQLCQKFLHEEHDQFQLSMLWWKVFSHENSELLQLKDLCARPLFKRSLGLATSFTLCAFLIGYYDFNFLRNLYAETIVQFYQVDGVDLPLTLKEKLEKIRLSEKIDRLEVLEAKKFFDQSFLSKTLLFEKRDGSGLRELSENDMTDLENVFLALNEGESFFEFEFNDDMNILMQIFRGELECEKRILKGMQRVLDENSSLD